MCIPCDVITYVCTCITYELLHFDQSANVRMICLKALQELYNPSLVYHLSMFTAKFKERLMKMRCDVDEAVAVESIKLLGQMLQ